MKKIALLLSIILSLMCIASCSLLPFGGDNTGDKPGEDVGDNDDKSDGGAVEPETPDAPSGSGDPEDSGDQKNDDVTVEPGNSENPDDKDDQLPEIAIEVTEIQGLNEQIYVNIKTTEDLEYSVFYKHSDDSDFTELEKELIIKNSDSISCYILGIKNGEYEVKIEAESESDSVSKIFNDISVAKQDRSGYAHFNFSNGIGAYNDDGTLKEGTKVVYVTNENKNTVTLEIDGTEYVGLVNILQAQYKSDTPMLIRVIGKITTNQWNYKNVEPRLSDGSNAIDDFFENTFSNEYGENLANLSVKMKGNGGGAQTYNYKTTPDGLTDVRLTNSGTKYTSYKGSDFPAFSGKSVYDDDSYYNMLEVKGSKNITIEGVGPDAEFFQFGISFEESSSIEIKNIAFTGYPEDALNFLGGDREDLASYGRYWIHSCTFNRGYNAWDISGERDKYAGDGSIDFNNVSYMTLAYNVFNSTKKSMLFGSGDSEGCMSFTMHHNHFYKVESRLPLGRNVNIHSYNNYFDECKNASDIRKNSYIFSEANYFNSTSKPFVISSSAVKSYGDLFISSTQNGATIATTRDQSVSISCKPDKTTSFSNFDTNPDLFYYDDLNKVTIADYLLAAEDVPEFVLAYAGAGVMIKLP